jgi:hypothetical protein
MCQVEEHEESNIPPSCPAMQKQAEVSKQAPKKPPHQQREYIIGVDDEELKEGIANGKIPSTVANSAATSGVGTIGDLPSNKQFILPDGTVIPATEIAEYPFEVRTLAKVLHITPGVSQNSLLSTVKFVDANYITIFDKDEVNIYDANDTIITVTIGAILRGWCNNKTNLWCILLVRMVRNLNTDTVLLTRPPSEFLLKCPDPAEAVHSVYELKSQPS